MKIDGNMKSRIEMQCHISEIRINVGFSPDFFIGEAFVSSTVCMGKVLLKDIDHRHYGCDILHICFSNAEVYIYQRMSSSIYRCTHICISGSYQRRL